MVATKQAMNKIEFDIDETAIGSLVVFHKTETGKDA